MIVVVVKMKEELYSVFPRVRLRVIELEVARAELAHRPGEVDGEIGNRAGQPVAPGLWGGDLLDS